MCSLFYLIKIKFNFKFIINKRVFLRFFSVFFYNLYKCNLIISVFNSVNNEETFFIFIFNFINSKKAFFKFFFTFFFYNLYKYNLIIFIFNKEVIINNI